MKKVHVGLDIGTTTIAVIVMDLAQSTVLSSHALPNKQYPTGESYAYAQDPHAIEQSARTLLSWIAEPIASICVTGQVHGILYYDATGLAVSPLYTWLDRRAMEKVDGVDSQQLLYEKTGCHLPSGYGLLAHYANRRLGRVPSQAVGFCGILEYITSRLIGKVIAKSDPSCLGPFGAFDPITSTFEPAVLREVLGSDARFLSASDPFEIAGYTPEGSAVAYPVGDNQAGFFGMVSDWKGSALVSMGTSGQISIFSQSTDCPSTMELRPFLGEGYLHVGATLTAGKAYETVERFLASVIRKAGLDVSDEAVFDLMKQAGLQEGVVGSLQVDTRLNGSRRDPQVRGSISGIEIGNLTLGNLVLGTVDGIVGELCMFSHDASSVFQDVKSIVATGSSVRKNQLFKDSLKRIFNLPILVADVPDGAGLGAALIGALGSGGITKDRVRQIVQSNLVR